jgi:hypothetical protein
MGLGRSPPIVEVAMPAELIAAADRRPASRPRCVPAAERAGRLCGRRDSVMTAGLTINPPQPTPRSGCAGGLGRPASLSCPER